MEMVDKATEKRWKRKMGRLLWTRRLYSPWFLLVYYWFWRILFRFCWLGGVRRRTPVLTGCIFLFFLYFFWYLWERHLYRKNSYLGVIKKLEIEENRLVFVDGSQVKLGEMRWYRTQGELAPTAREQGYIQRFYLYLNLTKPSDQLYLSCTLLDSGGKALRLSYLMNVMTSLAAFRILLVER